MKNLNFLLVRLTYFITQKPEYNSNFVLLPNIPYSSQVSSCVTLQQNNSITHTQIVTPRNVHTPRGLDSKDRKCLQLKIRTSQITTPCGLVEGKNNFKHKYSKLIYISLKNQLRELDNKSRHFFPLVIILLILITYLLTMYGHCQEKIDLGHY